KPARKTASWARLDDEPDRSTVYLLFRLRRNRSSSGKQGWRRGYCRIDLIRGNLRWTIAEPHPVCVGPQSPACLPGLSVFVSRLSVSIGSRFAGLGWPVWRSILRQSGGFLKALLSGDSVLFSGSE